jgi:hypothetical protein
MIQRLAAALCGWLLFASACGRPGSSSSRSVPRLDDSAHMIVVAYERGAISLEVASRQLAALIEPTGGLATDSELSPRAKELMDATGRELRNRTVKRSGIADSRP